ncbi:MAG: endonuclease domain-containing protein [Microgenomates group bacterium]
MKHLVPVEALTARQNLKYLDTLRNLARKGRVNSTKTENILWYEILNNRRLGYKFTRQKPIGKFIADFYCSELLLIVEVDGGYHLRNKYYDNERDKYFDILNILTIRINSRELMSGLDNVRNRLESVVREREILLKSSPSSRGGGPADAGPEGF